MIAMTTDTSCHNVSIVCLLTLKSFQNFITQTPSIHIILQDGREKIGM